MSVDELIHQVCSLSKPEQRAVLQELMVAHFGERLNEVHTIGDGQGAVLGYLLPASLGHRLRVVFDEAEVQSAGLPRR